MAEIRTMPDLMRAILKITRRVWKIQGQGILVCKRKGLYKVGDEEGNYVFLQFGDTIDLDLVKTVKVMVDWVNPPPNKNKGEPHFSEMCYPGRRSRFSL